ncbi:hypothetical protein ACI8AC_14460 [Geodermatophilus sp. SYSU D00758]
MSAPPATPLVELGLVRGPGVAADLADRLADELGRALAERHPQVRWSVRTVEDPLVRPPADDDDLVDAARRRSLAEDWDLAVVLTDLPLTVARRPVVAHASPLHGVGLLSVPALGAVGTRRRALEVAVGLVRTLLGDEDDGDRDAVGRRLRELATDPADAGAGVRFTARVLSGNLTLLLGMVRANRPWRLAVRLSRALTAAVAAGVFALITPDVWVLSDTYGGVRLTLIALGSVAAVVTALVVGGALWERVPRGRGRKQVLLFDLATVATVVLGVLTLHAALFVLALAGALLLVVDPVLAEGLGHPTGFGDHLALAWLTCSLATVGGALGAGLESDDAVREAAYTRRSEASGTEPGPPAAGMIQP